MSRTYVGESKDETSADTLSKLRSLKRRSVAELVQDADLTPSPIVKMSPPILSALHDMSVELDTLLDAANLLYDRLNPVLTDPPAAKNAGPADKAEMPVTKRSSPLLADLERKTAQIMDVRAGIEVIIDRLQI